MPAVRDQVFISYSHKDREWLSKLQTMLKPMCATRSSRCGKTTVVKLNDELPEI